MNTRMLGFYNQWLLSILVFVFVGCAGTPSSQNNSPTEFVVSTISSSKIMQEDGDAIYSIFVVKDTRDTNVLCVTVIQRDFWTDGVYADELSDHLFENLELEINGNQIPKSEFNASKTLASDINIYDSDGNQIGSYGTPIDVCYTLSTVGEGKHTASIRASDIVGKYYNHEWLFTVTATTEQS